MANFNKPFNFRGGLQVGEDVLVVRGNAVGISTDVPREVLDVAGNIVADGGLVVGGNISVPTGIISAFTFVGDGSGLTDVPASIGATGATGPTGPVGPLGLLGPRGPKGDPGGATGIQGDVGERGTTGATGATGIQGLIGTTGATGDGFTGGSYNSSNGTVTFTSDDGLGFVTEDLRGSTGVAGPVGATGERGPLGPSVSYQRLNAGDYLNGLSYNGEVDVTWDVDADTSNTADTVVARDASGNFSAGTITANLVGNSSSSTQLQNVRLLWGQSFDGSTDITGSLVDVTNITATSNIIAGSGSGSVALSINDGGGDANVTFNHTNQVPDQNGNAGRISVNVGSLTGASMTFGVKSSVAQNTTAIIPTALVITESTISANLPVTADITGDLIGNASTATALRTTRSIWGQNFDGTGDVSGTLTGVTNITGSNSQMIIQPLDSTTGLNLVLRGNNDTNGSGGGGVIIGDESRGNVIFRTSGLYKFARAGQTGTEGILNFNSLSGDRTFTFPNTAGTIALISSTVDNALKLNGYSESTSNTDNTIVRRDSSGNFSAGTITATLSGTATNATNFNVLADNSTNSSHYIIFTNGASDNQRPNSNTTLRYNPSSNTLTSGTFSGALSGDGSSITNLTTSQVAEGTNLYYTDEKAQDAAGALTTNAVEVGLQVTYNDSNNRLEYRNWIPTITTTSKNLSINELCSVITAGRTLTLPPSPSVGDKVIVAVQNDDKDTVINRNGELIMGLAENITLNFNYPAITMVFVGGSIGWRVI
jgi:hypothetical protein